MPECFPTLDCDHDAITMESEALIQQIAAAMYPAVASERNAPVISSSDGNVESVLLQLTQAVAEAKNEADRERSLRMVLELENEIMRHKEFLLKNSTRTPYLDDSNVIATGHPVPYFDYSRSTTSGSTMASLVDNSMSLSDCLSLFSSMPPHMQNSLYMSYFESGLNEIDTDFVAKVYQPTDFESLCFVMFGSSAVDVPQSLVKFTVEDLEAIISASLLSPLHSTTSPSTSAEYESYYASFEDAPRMNLLDALNVGSDDDISHIITVRKCHKLGFKSNIFLKQYFSKFGKVDRVVLLPMRTKQLNKGNRPSSMGFVVFENSSVVGRVLETPTHTIKGWPIEVRNFVKPADKPDEEFGWQ